MEPLAASIRHGELPMTNRYILTGAPGAGKTTLIRHLERGGFHIIEEAATDVIALRQAGGIAEPWEDAGFLAEVTRLQELRLGFALHVPVETQFHDRSVFCTYALAQFQGRTIPDLLQAAVQRALHAQTFRREVFFVDLLDSIEPTAARRIGMADAIVFAGVHRQVYEQFGFTLVPIGRGEIVARAAVVLGHTHVTNPA
jgi:predicted ATPase